MTDIGIAFVGTISAGKTTLLNALFTESLGNTHIKKTTLLPHIYHESTKVDIYEHIKENTADKNLVFLKNIAESKIEKLEEIHYNVKKLNDFIKFQKEVNLKLYDIPGLNDSTTKNIYYEYLNGIFKDINIIIWTIDVNSSINTSDEIDICNNLINNIKSNY